jgi:hypothetical protein
MRSPGIYRVITHYPFFIVISDYRVTGNIQLRLDMNPLFMNATYVGNVSDFWKAWHEEGVDVITKCKDHSSKWRASWKPAEVKQFSRLRFIINLAFLRAKGHMDDIPRVLQELDAEKGKLQSLLKA